MISSKPTRDIAVPFLSPVECKESFVFSKDHRGNRKIQLNDAYPSDFDVRFCYSDESRYVTLFRFASSPGVVFLFIFRETV